MYLYKILFKHFSTEAQSVGTILIFTLKRKKNSLFHDLFFKVKTNIALTLSASIL